MGITTGNERKVLFSVIVPIYNTPIKSLEQMLESVLQQDYQKFELILVNDGSKIECANYMDSISWKDKRIKVIHQKNAGVSAARNTGIEEAIGDYIVFIDADDTIYKNFFSRAICYIKEFSPDIIYGTLEYVPHRNVVQHAEKVDIFEKDELINVKETLLGIMPRKISYQILGTPCARVYKTILAKQVGFRVGVPLCEDQLFNREVLELAERVLVVPDVWYYYIQNDFSVMHSAFYTDYYQMALPYWEVLMELNKKEPDSLQELLRIKALGLFYTAVSVDCIGRSLNTQSVLSLICQRAEHPLIEDAVKYLRVSSPNLKTSQRIGLMFLKLRLYRLVYIGLAVKKRRK